MTDKANKQTPPPSSHLMGAARSFMELFVAETGGELTLTVEDVDHTELAHRYAELEAALSGVQRPEIDDLEERFENARQAASETHSSWEARCHAILNALGFDFGRPNVAATGDDLADCFRHHITTTIGWLAFGARPGPEMQMYEEGFKAGYRRCKSDGGYMPALATLVRILADELADAYPDDTNGGRAALKEMGE